MRYTLKYTGPKANVSQYGVTFEGSKEDRFIYLDSLLQMLVALEKLGSDKTLNFVLQNNHFKPEEILEQVRKRHIDIDQIIQAAIDSEEAEYTRELDRVEKNRYISTEERETWVNNLKIMHDYTVQRSINKAVYHVLMNLLADALIENRIEYIMIPLENHFVHITKTLHSLISGGKDPVESNTVIVNTAEGAMAKFEVRTRR